MTCSGNKVIWNDYSATDDVAEYAASQRAQCEKARKKYEAGTFFDEDDEDDDYDDYDDYDW